MIWHDPKNAPNLKTLAADDPQRTEPAPAAPPRPTAWSRLGSAVLFNYLPMLNVYMTPGTQKYAKATLSYPCECEVIAA